LSLIETLKQPGRPIRLLDVEVLMNVMISISARRLMPFLTGLAMLLAACVGTPPKPAGQEQTAAPSTAQTVPAQPVIPPLDLHYTPGQGLTEDVLYALLLAELAGQRGQVDVALDEYLQLAHALPDPRVAERATRIAIYAHDEAHALEAAQRWVFLEPENLEAQQVLAAILIQANRVEEALDHLEIVLNSPLGTSSQRTWAVANTLSRQDDKRAAMDVMDKLLARHERNPDALFAYALLALRAGDMDKARAAMEEVIDSEPRNLGVIGAYLGVLQKQGQGAIAISWLEEVLNQRPKLDDLRLLYARMLAEARRYDDARKQFERVEKSQPKNADVHYALGLIALEANQTGTARRHFHKLITLDGHSDDGRFYLGQIAELQKDYAGAAEWYRSVKAGENRFDAQMRVALMLARQNKVPEAQKALHAIPAENDEQRLRLVRAEAELLTEVGQYDQAMLIYDRLLQDSEDSELLYARAMLAEKMGKLDQLERDLRHVLEQDPNNAQALNALGYTLADRTSRYDEAHDLIKKALELSPNDFYILDSMGWVLYRLGRWDEAVDFLKRAHTLRHDPEVAAHLGEVLWVKGDKAEARAIWKAALKTAPEDKTLKTVIDRFGL
jgi:tetratricopeptide (TPR) repeat protein